MGQSHVAGVAALLEDRPGTVGQRAKALPVVDGPAEDRSERGPDTPSMGDDDARLTGLEDGEAVTERGDHAGDHVVGRLGAWDSLGGEASMGGRLIGERLGELRAGEALSGTHVVLPQPRVGMDSQADCLGDVVGRLHRASEVRGPQRLRLEPDEPGGDIQGLGVAHIIEGDVGVPLGPSLEIPGGLAVADQDEGLGSHRGSWATAAGSSISGQSRQSRSIA